MENILEKITLRFPETEAELKEIIENQCAIFGDDAAFYDDLAVFAQAEIVAVVTFIRIIIGLAGEAGEQCHIGRDAADKITPAADDIFAF